MVNKQVDGLHDKFQYSIDYKDPLLQSSAGATFILFFFQTEK